MGSSVDRFIGSLDSQGSQDLSKGYEPDTESSEPPSGELDDNPQEICKKIAELKFGKTSKLEMQTEEICKSLMRKRSQLPVPGSIAKRAYCQNVLDALQRKYAENAEVEQLLEKLEESRRR